MNNRDYLFERIGWLYKIEEAVANKRNQCLVIDKLNLINNPEGKPIKVQGVHSTSYPATFTVRDDNNQTQQVDLWVKETRVGFDTPVPYTLINECKLMGSVVRDMLIKNRSPHFVYPVAQILTNDRSIDEEELLTEAGKIKSSTPLCSSKDGEHLSIYNIMEPLHSDYLSYVDYIRGYDFTNPDYEYGLVTGFFQILYNLSVMEKLQFRHNDLHGRNIMLDPTESFEALYVIDQATSYYVQSPLFVLFIDFDRSIINTDKYKSIPMPERYLETLPCSIEVAPNGNRVANLPDTVEDCWKVWNPYADMTRFLTGMFSMFSKRVHIYDILFKNDKGLLEDLNRLMDIGNPRYKFGRQSLGELQEQFKDEPEFLNRCLPTNVLKRFSRQFFTERNPKSVLKAGFRGKVYSPSV